MLTQICQYLRNWFERERLTGTFAVVGGELTAEDVRLSDYLQDGQYYRVIGSVFNDGVHKYGDALTDEKAFDGTFVSMGIPPTLVELAAEIEAWQAKYGGVGSAAMSPYSSESFGPYSYSKSGNASADGTSSSVSTWQSVFAALLASWRKI